MALQRVAVVGAGAAGLCAARHILSRRSFGPPVVFEASDSVGGTWRYEDLDLDQDQDGTRPVHSSMYRDLRTNLPKEVMMFPDFPFDPELSSFLPHHEILNYLDQYCQVHEIRPHIRFNTLVDSVKPVVMATDGEEKTEWEVTSSDSSGGQRSERFDSVFVCSGHYSEPYIPHIPGIKNFKGRVLHSHSYRAPEPFSGLSVLILGAKASGLDISIELAAVGAQVTLSHARPPLPCPLPGGVRQSGPLVAVLEGGSVLFQDGSESRPDVLMFCTGYRFRFPFLDPALLGLEVQDHLVTPLYHFLFPPKFPSLIFIGICKIICPFPNFHIQVQFALAVLEGLVSLPSRAQMEDQVQRDQQARLDRGVERRHLLVLEQDQWSYCRDLASAAGVPPLAPVVQSLYQEVWRQRRVHPQDYRRLNYRLLDQDRWEVKD